MSDRLEKLRIWWDDQSGLESAEWVLVLAAAVVPAAYFIFQIALFVARFYQITSWVTTLPFP